MSETKVGGGIAVAQTLVSATPGSGDPPALGQASTEAADGSQPPRVRVSEGQLEDDGFESRYQVRAVLGKGGMGEVRVCKDRRVGREVALKVVHAKFGDRADMKERFLREARVQGQLEHPAVVPVYDLGRGPDGEPYFTMKRVRGVTLERILEGLRAGDDEIRKKYSPRKLLSAVASICLALEFVHGRGVVHRDLKPSNVMLGDYGEVYLLDWGLAKILGMSDLDEGIALDGASREQLALSPAALSSAGSFLGTPGYMAREQLVGGLFDVDSRADVYALGAILFEVLTLERLHAGKTAEAVLRTTLDGADARPSVRAPPRDVPPELEAICVRATATWAADRYESARAMCDAIERYLDGDRDVEQRRSMATLHAQAAEQAMERALGADAVAGEASRRTAMREFSRALALDPENPVTLRSMVRLFTEPPRELPREVKAELHQLAVAQVRLGGKAGALAYLSFLLYVPLSILMGPRSAWMWAPFVLAVLTSALSFAVSRLPRPLPRHALAVFAMSLLSVGTMSAMFGPFILVPAIVASSALVFSTTLPRSMGGAIVAFGCLAVVVPYALEVAGIVPRSMVFTPEGLLLVPRAIGLPQTWTPIYLMVSNVAVVLTAGFALAPFRNELNDAQRRIRLLAWHLRQLVPDEALDASRERHEAGAAK